MENFFNYITKPLKPEDIDIWFKMNNIIPEKLELYSDFSHTLYILIHETYLGQENVSMETKIRLTDDDNIKHFEWCWNKVVNNFSKENILIEQDGEHKIFLKDFIFEIYYEQKNKYIKDSMIKFFQDVFKLGTVITKSDLDLITTIYKTFNRSTKFRFT